MSAVHLLNPLLELKALGQSIWMDSFRRGWIRSGELCRLIEEDGITGVTVNPTIFEKAVSGSTDYDDAIRELFDNGKSTEQMYESLMVEDIREAADVFRGVYDSTDGRDGFVSIELPPTLAYNTEASIREARRYWELVDRPNIMVKVPGTAEGVPAVEELTYVGVNVNITLLFSIESYEAVARAYIRGLERRAEDGESIDRISSVASFFVSRIDTAVDKHVQEMKTPEAEALLGKAAVANAKLAYQRYKDIFGSPEFADMEEYGARVQRVLWASTSTKNPRYPDTYYVDNLIGQDTVNTLPPQTLFAFKDHGHPCPTLEENIDEAQEVMKRLNGIGIDFDAIIQKLQDDGVQAFQKSVDDAMKCLNQKREALERKSEKRQTAHLGQYQPLVESTLQSLGEQSFTRRIWERDAGLWKQPLEGEKIIKNRLGWMTVVEAMSDASDEIMSFADWVRGKGIDQAVLLGMGGSSLCPRVSQLTFGNLPGYPELRVLDSTVPAAILEIEQTSDLARTLFIVSSKSGATVETISAFHYFYDKMQALRGDSVGESFCAITDPGTQLETEARDRGFHKVFLNPPDIGGRYSALSYFGLVPAAIIGVDINKLLDRASTMMESCSACVGPPENPGVELGTILGSLAMAGRNKVTLVASPAIAAFGYWLEQLIAESTGKSGAGLIPIEGEPIGQPDNYGNDRVFVYLKLGSDPPLDRKVLALQEAGHPVVKIRFDDKYDLGQEYFRWEMAIATAGAILGVNAFDEPNVKESKDNTNRLLEEFKSKGSLPEEKPVVEEMGIKLFCDAEMKESLDEIRAAGPYADHSIQSYIKAQLDQFEPGDYFALMGFVQQSALMTASFQCVRGQLRDAYKAATSFGYGPRFLHSVGQLHKGGPNTGIYIQFTADDPQDVPIPGEQYTFGTLKHAQALGDEMSLRSKGRPLIRLHLGRDVSEGMNRVLEWMSDSLEDSCS